jgi:hypothetical protein
MKTIRQMSRREELERRTPKIGIYDDTPQAMWPIVKSLMKRDGPRTSTTIHGPLGLEYHPLEITNTTADFRKSVHSQ